MSLKEIDFSNVYIGSEVNITGPNVSPNPTKIDPELVQDLKEKCQSIYRKTGKVEFPVEFEGIRFRASLINTIKEDVFVCRRMPETVIPLSELRIYDGYTRLFLGPELTGLVVIVLKPFANK